MPAELAGERALARLTTLLDEETTALGAAAPIDWEGFAERKARILFELRRGSRGREPGPEASLRRAAAILRASLERNAEVIALHLRAAAEVTDILTRAIGEARSDGTYPARAPARREP